MKRTFLLLVCLVFVLSPARAQKAKKFVHETVAIPEVTPQVISVETSSSQMLLQVDKGGVVRMVHYGAPVGDPGQFVSYNHGRGTDYGYGPMAYPTAGGWEHGQVALNVRYPDGSMTTELRYLSHSVSSAAGVNRTEVLLKDHVTQMEVKLVYEAYQKEDVILAHSEIHNGGRKEVRLIDYASACLDLVSDRYLLTHFYGDWAYEMQVDREVLTHDVKIIESHRGVQTTTRKNPSFMLSLSTGEFSETSGEVIAGALAWSGNFRLSFQVDATEHLRIVSGMSSYGADYPLAAGQTFITPNLIVTWSGNGGGGASRNLHRWARHYGIYGGAKVIPTLLNSWEGAYFNFTTPLLQGMIDDAAAMGLEMFVLDDGWFAKDHPRNNDYAGLGDWELNTDKIPEGIDFLASYAHSKGIKFGIWIEPEMVNPDSNLAREHPEWIVQSPGRPLYQERNQWNLDLSNPEVQDFVFGVFDRTMSLSGNIDYIKWDCNRSVASVGSPYLGEQQERFYVEYIQGLYSVLARVREKYPHTLIECCSGGGSRVDYGALAYCDEFWASDNTDAASRVRIQYGTSLIYTACAIASDVSAVPNHQTGNVSSLKFRFDVACAGRLGMEVQPRDFTEEELAQARLYISSYKQFRDLVYEGDLYRLASPYEGDYTGLMYVSEDRNRAVVFTYCLRYQNRSQGTHSFHMQGLDPEKNYRVRELNVQKSCWWGDGQSFTGAFLSEGGFNPALLKANSSAVFIVEAE